MIETKPHPQIAPVVPPNEAKDRADQFVVLYARHEQELFRFVASLVPIRADAEDIVQNTASVLWKKFAEYDPARPFLAWAFGIARREVLSYARKASQHRKHFSPAVLEQLAERRATDEPFVDERQALAVCLKKLSADERDLLNQRYRDDRALVNRADAQQRGANALYKKLGRIRHKLSECIRLTLAQQGGP